MKDRIGKFIFVLTIAFILLLFSSPYLFIELWNIQSGRSTIFELTINDIKDDIDSAINKDKYNKILNEYIKKRFGDSLSKKFEIIKNNGRSYKVKFNDIMDETFYIAYNKGKHSCRDNFEQVISNDKKFQHLYSDWVKKQVGIEDENVELKFKEGMKGARLVGYNPYIEFDKINSLENLNEDICKNTHNLYLSNVSIVNFDSSKPEDVLKVVNNYEQLLKLWVFNAGDNILWIGVKLNDLVNDKEDPFSYGILFDYNTNKKKYYKYYENRSIENNKSEYISFE